MNLIYMILFLVQCHILSIIIPHVFNHFFVFLNINSTALLRGLHISFKVAASIGHFRFSMLCFLTLFGKCMSIGSFRISMVTWSIRDLLHRLRIRFRIRSHHTQLFYFAFYKMALNRYKITYFSLTSLNESSFCWIERVRFAMISFKPRII